VSNLELKCVVTRKEKKTVSEIFSLIKEPWCEVVVEIKKMNISVVSYFEKDAVVSKIDVWEKANALEDLIDDIEYYSGEVMQFIGDGVWLKFKLSEDILRRVLEKLLRKNYG
jgi:hypothetical protein